MALKQLKDKEIDNLTQVIDDSKKIQTENVDKFKSMVDAKQRELLELRKENDLSEQGVVTQPKRSRILKVQQLLIELLKT